MAELKSILHDLPEPPRNASAKYDGKDEVLLIKMASTPQSIRTLLMALWLLFGFLVFGMIEYSTKVLFTAVSSTFRDTDFWNGNLRYIYVFAWFLCAFLISIPFRLLSVFFKTKVAISSSEITISGLPRRRFHIDETTIIKFDNVRRGALRTSFNIENWHDSKEVKQVIVIDTGLNEEERIWLNKVLDELMAIKQA